MKQENNLKCLCLEVTRDVVPSEIQMDDVHYIAISEKDLTDVERENILLEYKKYIISNKEFYKSIYGSAMHDAGYRNYYENTTKMVFLGGIKFIISIVYPKCEFFINYKQFLELVRQKGKVYTDRYALFGSSINDRRYNSKATQEKILIKMRNASIDGLVQKKYHSSLHNLYVYYIDESESASIYIDYKRQIESKKKQDVKKKEKKLANGVSSFYIIYRICDVIGTKLQRHLRDKYPVWKKHSLIFSYTKANAHCFLEFAKNENITLDSNEFKELLPYIPGILKNKTKNVYYKFVKLAIEMKLIEESKDKL
jgi:hypothetical protein